MLRKQPYIVPQRQPSFFEQPEVEYTAHHTSATYTGGRRHTSCTHDDTVEGRLMSMPNVHDFSETRWSAPFEGAVSASTSSACMQVSALAVIPMKAYLFKEYSSNTAVQRTLKAKVH